MLNDKLTETEHSFQELQPALPRVTGWKGIFEYYYVSIYYIQAHLVMRQQMLQ